MVLKIKPVYYFVIGIVTITAANMTVSIDAAGWIACVPFLIYLRQTNEEKS